VTYQDNGRFIPGSTSFSDGLADSQQCARDVPLLKRLGINTILVSSVTTAAEHASCMRLLEEAGIYVILILNGLSEDAQFIDGARVLPWDYTAYARFFERIDAFRKFSNTMAFAVELTDMSDDSSHFTPKLKSVVRDMKEYIANKKHRAIPIGSFEHNHPANSFADYMRCGTPGEAVDFHGIKTVWDLPKSGVDPPSKRYGEPRCLNASFAGDQLVKQFKDYPIPTVLLNGCEAKYNHTFDEVPVIYKDLSDTFSGTIVENYFDEKQHDRG
jgi:Glucanosyltransferase